MALSVSACCPHPQPQAVLVGERWKRGIGGGVICEPATLIYLLIKIVTDKAPSGDQVGECLDLKTRAPLKLKPQQ